MDAVPAIRVRLRPARFAVSISAPIRAGLIAGVGAFVVLFVLFANWVHHSFEGKYHGPFLASEVFGVPEAARAHGVGPVMTSVPGWDGQFYFSMANDPLGRADTAQHVDSPTYRYQRIGVPAAAFAVSRLTGQSYTSAFVYHLVQLAGAAVGFGLLFGWLVHNGRAGWYALGWLAGAGPAYALLYGLPDAVGDAAFVATLLALWHRRLGWYAVAATTLCLIREGYTVVPFFVWLATATNRWSWNSTAGYARRFFLTALPGIAVLGWAVYLCLHFHVGLLSPERNPPGIYDWPLRAPLRCLLAYVREDNTEWVRYLVTSLFAVLVVLGSAVRVGRTHRAVWFAVPFVAVALCLGRIVWDSPQGYFKAAGSCLALGVFLVPFETGLLLRFVLAANVMLGVEWNVIANVVNPPWYPADVRFVDPMDAKLPTGAGPPVTDFRSTLVWVDPEKELKPTAAGAWRWTHRETIPLRVRVTNGGTQPWISTVATNRVEVGSVLFDRHNRPVSMAVVGMDPPLAPGQTREIDVPVRLTKPGYYTLMLGVTLDRKVWFHDREKTPAITFPVRVR
ncbi:MAG TPA: hypothetical protein VGJ05_04740 [Fimbriiglobus sp.]|jgi:hypothetical protein